MPSFDSSGPVTATVEVEVGDIRVTATDRADTAVEVRPSDSGSELDVTVAEQTRVEFTDGRLLVKAPKQQRLGLFGKPGSIEVDLRVPTGSHLEVRGGVVAITGVGEIGTTRVKAGLGDLVFDRTGPAELTTGTGAVRVGTITGTAEISTASGEIRVGSVSGEATVKNSNGSSRIGTVTGDLRVRASNGDIVVDRAGARVNARSANGVVRVGELGGDAELKTSMGEVEFGIPEGTAAQLDLHTQFGNVVNRLDRADAPTGDDRTLTVLARTSYGDIVIQRSGRDQS